MWRKSNICCSRWWKSIFMGPGYWWSHWLKQFGRLYSTIVNSNWHKNSKSFCRVKSYSIYRCQRLHFGMWLKWLRTTRSKKYFKINKFNLNAKLFWLCKVSCLWGFSHACIKHIRSCICLWKKCWGIIRT